MNSLIIKGTQFSPQITFNPEKMKFEISGESRPEDASKLYNIILEWLEEYLSAQKTDSKSPKIIFEFNLVYFNTVSAKYILEIMRCLLTYYTKGVGIKILWHYKSKDEDIKESGEEFARLVDIPFEFIVK